MGEKERILALNYHLTKAEEELRLALQNSKYQMERMTIQHSLNEIKILKRGGRR